MKDNSQQRDPYENIKRRAVPEGAEELRGGSGVQTVDREQFAAGLIVKKEGMETVTYLDGKDKKETLIHVFSGKHGRKFGLWGSADLDHRVKVAAVGDILWIAFDGVQPHPVKAGKTIAVFAVARLKADRAKDLVDESELGIDDKGEGLPF